MSRMPVIEPQVEQPGTPAIEQLIEAQPRDLGGFTVDRVLPSILRRSVGPFVFFDHFGPADFAPGTGMDVRPHPHINLATVTYLLEGEILHRDNIGSREVIRPGGINWMTAGRGIAHSERTPPEARRTGARAHGLQLWVALPTKHEESEPSFRHHDAAALPLLEDGGLRLRVLAGSAYGATSPVETLSSLFYVEVMLPAGAALPLPSSIDHLERAAYVIDGAVSCGSERVAARRMMVFARGSAPTLRAEQPTRLVLIGGEPLDGARHIWWNFVSSSKERIEQAKRDWAEGKFAPIPGDDLEFIPLPDRR